MRIRELINANNKNAFKIIRIIRITCPTNPAVREQRG